MKWNLSYPHYDRNVLLYFSLVQKQNQSITNHWAGVARVHWVTASCAESGRLATTEYIYGTGGSTVLPSHPPSCSPFLSYCSAFSVILLADFLSFFCSIFPPSFCYLCVTIIFCRLLNIYTALAVPRSFPPTLLPAAPTFLIAHRIFFHTFGGFSSFF